MTDRRVEDIEERILELSGESKMYLWDAKPAKLVGDMRTLLRTLAKENERLREELASSIPF